MPDIISPFSLMRDAAPLRRHIEHTLPLFCCRHFTPPRYCFTRFHRSAARSLLSFSRRRFHATDTVFAFAFAADFCFRHALFFARCLIFAADAIIISFIFAISPRHH